MKTNNTPGMLRTRSPEDDARLRQLADEAMREARQRDAERPRIQAEGIAAMLRLLPVAQRDSGQSSVVAKFLLSLYNSRRFVFDLTEFRRLDYKLFDDCMAVLKMDHAPSQELHLHIENGGAIFEDLANTWGFESELQGR